MSARMWPGQTFRAMSVVVMASDSKRCPHHETLVLRAMIQAIACHAIKSGIGKNSRFECYFRRLFFFVF